MPITPTYPGVYIEELPSGVRTIVGVATSITAFVGRALRGPVNDPVRVQSFPEFERIFGGLWVVSALGYSVQQFFLNGGTDALIVRVTHPDAATAILSPLLGAGGSLTLTAASPGGWGTNLTVTVDLNTKDPANINLFNLVAKDTGAKLTETYRNVSTDPNDPRFVTHVLADQSQLVQVSSVAPFPTQAPNAGTVAVAPLTPGSDGTDIDDNDVIGNQAAKTGMYALETADLFNLMVIPPVQRDVDVLQGTYETARIYCTSRRAMLIADAPWVTVPLGVTAETTGPGTLASRDPNAAVFFPHIMAPDPLKENRQEEFRASGAIAGIFARTDTNRGVWKAPAGIEATIAGASALSVKMTDGENGQLNPLGINCLRSFPVIGNVVWGARTYAGADVLANQWKYIPVRRLALYIEESLYRGTQWAVFEPNDQPLWAQLRLNVGSFMHDLFVKGAFQGSSPRDAYLVKCDSDTTTQNDINLGVVNILVGFAPLKPAEFVIIQIQQLAGNVQV